MILSFIFSPQFEGSLKGKHGLSYAKGTKYVAGMKAVWKRDGYKITKALEDITGLQFKEDMKCYINSEFSVSDPLCLKAEDTPAMRDNLIHELIHVLLSQNDSINRGWRKYYSIMRAKYPNASAVTITHVAIHAIHLLAAKKLTPRRIKSIRSYSRNIHYVRSWSILDELDIPEMLGRIFGR